jgi:hypothetical protein
LGAVETLMDFADGVLDQDGTIVVERHLMSGCPDGRCFLDGE